MAIAQKSTEKPTRLLTVDEVGEMLGIPRGCLYQWRLKRFGPKAVKVGKYLRYRREDVEAWILAQQG